MRILLYEEEIKKEFETHCDDLKNDKSLFVLITITSTEDIYGAYLEVTREKKN